MRPAPPEPRAGAVIQGAIGELFGEGGRRGCANAGSCSCQCEHPGRKLGANQRTKHDDWLFARASAPAQARARAPASGLALVAPVMLLLRRRCCRDVLCHGVACRYMPCTKETAKTLTMQIIDRFEGSRDVRFGQQTKMVSSLTVSQ